MLEGQATGSKDCSRKGSMFDFTVEVLACSTCSQLAHTFDRCVSCRCRCSMACRSRPNMGRPLGYSIFSLMALIRDPKY